MSKMSLIPRRTPAKPRPTNFSALRQDNAPRRLSVDPKSERLTSVVSRDAELEGKLTFRNGVKIDGVVRGDVVFGKEDGLCIISKGAVVDGTLLGPRALILGEVDGDVTITGTLVLGPTAVVKGAVQCAKFIVYDGAQIMGSIETAATARAPSEPAVEDSSVVVRMSSHRQT